MYIDIFTKNIFLTDPDLTWKWPDLTLTLTWLVLWWCVTSSWFVIWDVPVKCDMWHVTCDIWRLGVMWSSLCYMTSRWYMTCNVAVTRVYHDDMLRLGDVRCPSDMWHVTCDVLVLCDCYGVIWRHAYIHDMWRRGDMWLSLWQVTPWWCMTGDVEVMYDILVPCDTWHVTRWQHAPSRKCMTS